MSPVEGAQGSLNILIVCRAFPHHRAGGMEWHAQDVVEGLMERGHRVSVLTTPLPRTPALAPLKINGELIQVGDKQGAYSFKFVRNFPDALRAAVTRLKPDVIHAQGFVGVSAERALRKLPRSPKLVTTIHGTLWSETPIRDRPAKVGELWRWKHRFAFAPLWRRFLQGDSAKIFDSQFSLAEARREAKGKLGGATSVVPLGFDMARLPLLPRHTEERPTVLILSRLEPTKGVLIALKGFLDVARKSPTARLLVAGTGSELEAMRAMTNTDTAGNRVEFLGPVSQDRVPQLLADTDIFLNADQGYPAFGLANAEALACGAFIIASNRGAHAEVVASRDDGQLVDPPDAEGIATALRATFGTDIMAEPFRQERIERARARFTRERMIGLIEAAFAEAGKR